jgi:hypothetical protein
MDPDGFINFKKLKPNEIENKIENEQDNSSAGLAAGQSNTISFK